jgi:thiopeptide-type bacteriocin biosynthesis protein
MTAPLSATTPSVSPSAFFVVRTPLLPFDILQHWSDGLTARDVWEREGDGVAFRAAWEADRHALRARLIALAIRPEIQQALSLASPVLVASLEAWRRDPTSRKGLKTERALVRYLTRMASRPTPFGLFSGCSVGRVAWDRQVPTRVTLQASTTYRSDCRLDFDYLFAVTAALQRDPLIAAESTYRPNATLRRVGAAWHYLESTASGAARAYRVVRLDADPFLDIALQRAAAGARINQLVEAILAADDADDLTRDEAGAFVHELIESQVVVSDLSPVLTGPNPLDDIIAQLDELPSGRSSADALESIRAHIRALSNRRLGASTTYDEPPALTSVCATESRPTNWLQVDTFKPVHDAVLGGAVVDDIVQALEILARIGPGEELGELESFRNSFITRYERAWVPLEQALDDEVGLDFGGRPSRTSPSLSTHHSALLRKLTALDGRYTDGLRLSLEDLPERPAQSPPFPDAFDVSCIVVAKSQDALAHGEYQLFLKGCTGPSGARLLGRFCHGDPAIEKGVSAHLRDEEAHGPDAVYAEVVYLPEGRVGNVLCRPVLREYEIVVSGRSGAAADRQLPISDLLVTVNARREIVLWSKRLNRRIIPRLTNAHGFMNATLPATYRFLCYLQHQGAALHGFNWGPLQSLPALPRVCVGRLVLSPAMWRLTKDDIAGILADNGATRFAAIQAIRRTRSLPRWISFVEGDNTLVVDLDNPLSTEAFTQVLARSQAAFLVEMYPPVDELCVNGPEGRFTHEFVVPFVRRRPQRELASASRPALRRVSLSPAASAGVRRDLRYCPPGSEWLFVKIYGGEATVDRFATRSLPELVRGGMSHGAIRSWFLVRYKDPEWHIRLRFCGDGQRLLGEWWILLSRHVQPLLDAGFAWRIELDTYQREIERYGGLEAMSVSEHIFCADTEAALTMLAALPEDDTTETRWQLALCGVDRLLGDGGLTLEQREVLVTSLCDGFRKQHGLDTQYSIATVNQRFRAERVVMESLLDGSPSDSAVVRAVVAALDDRSIRVKPLFQALRDLHAGGRLTVSLDEVLCTYVHMHVNRVLRGPSPRHELLVYEFLARLYKARLARERAAIVSYPAGTTL